MTYQYFYQRHPFDDKNYFFVEADTQEEADRLACLHMDGLRNDKQTVMTNCYRSDRAMPNQINKKQELAYILFFSLSVIFGVLCYIFDKISILDFVFYGSAMAIIAGCYLCLLVKRL